MVSDQGDSHCFAAEESYPREGSESMDRMEWDNLWSMLSPLQRLNPIKPFQHSRSSLVCHCSPFYLNKEKLLLRDFTDTLVLKTTHHGCIGGCCDGEGENKMDGDRLDEELMTSVLTIDLMKTW